MPPIINAEKCIRCGTCASICNSHILSFKKGEIPVVRFPDECWHCDSCILDCPADAIELRIPLTYMLRHVDANTLTPGE